MIKYLAAATIGGYITYRSRTSEQDRKDVEGALTGFTNTFGAVYVVGLSVLDYKFTLRNLTYNTKEYFAERSIVHGRVADRILALSIANRGVYLKAGQYIGNLERIMPKEYTQVLRVLQDSGPSVPFDEIKIVIEHDMKEKWENIFDSFNQKAIAAASLAQVHEATLKPNGERVAVKLQFPSLRTQYKYDLMVIGFLSKVCDNLIKLAGSDELKLQEIFKTFQGTLNKELNFLEEAKNGQRTGLLFKDYKGMHIPGYYNKYCSQRMLVMEFVEGVKINDVEAISKLGLKPADCADRLVDIFGQMIFKHGHVHCDAHPGNILVRPMADNPTKPQIVLLDHGFYSEIDPRTLDLFRRMWVSLAKFDYKAAAKYARDLGMEDQHIEYLPLIFFYRTLNSKKKLGDTFQKEERSYVRGKDLAALESVSRLMRSLPPELLFVIRAANLVGIHNAILGGTTRSRLKRFTRMAIRELHSNPISYIIAYGWLRLRLFLFEHLHGLYMFIF